MEGTPWGNSHGARAQDMGIQPLRWYETGDKQMICLSFVLQIISRCYCFSPSVWTLSSSGLAQFHIISLLERGFLPAQTCPEVQKNNTIC